MIEKVISYRASDGAIFATLEQVKEHELCLLLAGKVTSEGIAVDCAAHKLVENGSKVIDILSTGPKSIPKARAINGGTKKRKAKESAQPVLPTIEESNLV